MLKLHLDQSFQLHQIQIHNLNVEILKEGDTLYVQSGCPYRINAISDCKIIEVGNHSGDHPIRIEDDYGRSIVQES